jgi:hypothetical protein
MQICFTCCETDLRAEIKPISRGKFAGSLLYVHIFFVQLILFIKNTLKGNLEPAETPLVVLKI